MAKPHLVDRLLDKGLDELAISSHAGFAPRVAVNAAVAGVFALFLPWQICLGWGALTLGLEGMAWFATRRQFQGLPITWRTRLWHACGLAISSFAWIGLGMLAWTSGSIEGAICAVVVWLSVVFFSQTNAYQSPLGFVLSGVMPGAAVITTVLVAPRPPHVQLFPVLCVLALALTFAVEGVSRMLKARRAHAETESKLRENEALYRVLADNVTDVIALTGMDGERIYISPSIEQALGYSPGHLYTTPNYTYLHPDDRDELRRKVAGLTESGDEIICEYRVVRADDEVIWVETSFALTDAEEGQPPRVVSVSRNIERRKELEAQLIEAREAAESAAAAKSDFLANMTHELRTPLNAIIGFSGVLQASPNLSAGDARHARLIGQASATLLDLVNSVLDFSRLEAGAVELDPAPFDPAAETHAIIELLEEQAKAKGLELILEVDGAGWLDGDAKRLRQVLLNFLSNAIKFTSRGGVVVTVAQSPAKGDHVRLRVEVADTGVGLPQSQIGHIFERFTQADVSVSRRYGGTGLGLAICKRTVELMGGQIGARSVEGEGSTFWFEVTLPRADAPAETMGAVASAPAAAQLEHPLRLLLVEDVEINRELVRTVLAPFDIDVDTAEDGVAAIEAFRNGTYDLVLMDVQMPVMDGLTAARRIRALPTPAAAATPIIAMTANVLPEQIAKCIEAGMDDHLGKPMQPAKLLEAISRWSAGRQAAMAQPEAVAS